MVDTIPSRLIQQAHAQPNNAAYYVKSGRSWVPTSWRDFEAQIRQATKALLSLGLRPGQAVGLLGFNRPEWVIFDVAAMAAGGAPCGLY
ncbi:MAG: AMP-binding protein, partial [Myxococcota bacterium]